MSTLRPIGFQPASFPAKTTQPQFAGGNQSTQRSENDQQQVVRRHIIKPEPGYKERAFMGATAALTWIMEKSLRGASYLMPNTIRLSTPQEQLETFGIVMPDPENPEDQSTANHELGHAIASLSINNPMRSLSVIASGEAGGMVTGTFDASTGKENQAEFCKELIFQMGGLGAELSRATPDELRNKEFLNGKINDAGSDIGSVISLIQHAQKQGWIKLASNQIPSSFDQKIRSQVIAKSILLEKGLAENTLTETEKTELEEEIQKLVKPLQDAMNLPIVQRALKAGGEIHKVIPVDKREDMIRFVANKGYLDQDELYFMLANFVDEDELKRMQAISKRFVKVQDPNVPSHMLQLLDKQKPRIDTEQPSFQVLQNIMGTRRPGLISNFLNKSLLVHD